MKKILFLLLLPITCFAQSEISNFWEYGDGSRGISTVINDQNDSYTIFNDKINNSYIPILYLKADGTFLSTTTSYSECANNCSYYSIGTFKKIDETHIQLQIKVSGQSDLCPGGRVTNTEPRDLGIFEIRTYTEPRDLGIFGIRTYKDRYDLIKINNKIFTNKKTIS